MTNHFIPSRRDLLKGGGALVVSFSLAGRLDPRWRRAPRRRGRSRITEVDAFLTIDPRGRVTLYSGKVDMGTGVRTALMQICADELDVPLNAVQVIEGDTALTPDQGKTWGSLTIQLGGMQIRNAAATARAALVEQAAKRLGVKAEELQVANGVIRGGGKRVTYGELIGGKAFSLKLDHAKPAKFKDPKAYRIVGKSVPRVDIPDKVAGRFMYINNFRVPGMLHGRVVRPPSVGAKLESVDEGSIKDIAGIVQVVREGNFLGVVAQTEWAAIKASMQLKANWSKWEGLPEQSKLYGACARHQSGPLRCHRYGRQHGRGDGQGRRQEDRRHLRLRDPHPRLARPVLRGRVVPGRQADLLVGLAGDPRSAQAARGNAGAAGGERALHLFRRLRLLWPQRPRGCRGRRRLAVEGGRPAGAGAMVARRRARLGSEGPARR